MLFSDNYVIDSEESESESQRISLLSTGLGFNIQRSIFNIQHVVVVVVVSSLLAQKHFGRIIMQQVCNISPRLKQVLYLVGA